MTYSFVLSREELEQDNRELFLLKKYNENIIRNLPIGVVILDLRKRISVVNFAAVRILALGDEELIGLPVGTLFARCAMERAREIEETISPEDEHAWEELHCGDKALIRLRAFPFKDDDYKHLGTILVIEDISRDRYFQDYLLRSEKIASIAELATGVAHEISNPLSVVLNYVDLLKRGHANGTDAERLSKIERELHRIGEFIGSLLSFSKVRKIPMEPLSVARLISDVVLLVEHRVREKCVDLRVRAAPEDILVYGDENSLKQVFVNLLINSVEAVLERGSVEVAVDRIEEGDCVEISVIDDGCGIPPDIKERIFDPFFQHEGREEEHRARSVHLPAHRRVARGRHPVLLWREDGHERPPADIRPCPTARLNGARSALCARRPQAALPKSIGELGPT